MSAGKNSPRARAASPARVGKATSAAAGGSRRMSRKTVVAGAAPAPAPAPAQPPLGLSLIADFPEFVIIGKRSTVLLLTVSMVASIAFWIADLKLAGLRGDDEVPDNAEEASAFEEQIRWMAFSKWMSMGALSVLTLIHMHRKRLGDWLLVLALISHSIGDVILTYRFLAFSLPFFGAGHLFYLGTFVCDLLARDSHKDKKIAARGARRWTAMLLVLVGASYLYHHLAGGVPDGLQLPLQLYICAISAMMVCSLLPHFLSWWVPAGAALYLASDALIGLDEFGPAPLAPNLMRLTWPLYYGGQLILVCGLLWERHHFSLRRFGRLQKKSPANSSSSSAAQSRE